MDAVGNERELEADVREGTGEYGGTVEILRGRERAADCRATFNREGDDISRERRVEEFSAWFARRGIV